MTISPSSALQAPFKTYSQALAFLDALDLSVMKMGTDRIRQVLTALGNPQQQFPSIHVVGTNGKGSVCATLASVYTAAGFKTGMFISPHLISVRERIQLQGSPVTETQFLQAAQAVAQAMLGVFPHREDGLTYFEFLTAMAFWLFAQERVEIAVIEAGLGGRLDATNVLDAPLAVVVTPVSLDHQDRLGSTVEAIAAEKAGVFKPKTWVITGGQTKASMGVLQSQAKQVGCRLREANPTSLTLGPLVEAGGTVLRRILWQEAGSEEIRFSLLGRYQAENLCIALELVKQLLPVFEVSHTVLKEGLRHVQWPGRFQFFPERRLVIDGSHNQAGFQSLLETLEHDFPAHKIHWGISLMANRDPKMLLPLVNHKNTGSVSFLQCMPSERFHDPQDLVRNYGSGEANLFDAEVVSVNQFLACPVHQGEIKIVTGSLYTAGQVLEEIT